MTAYMVAQVEILDPEQWERYKQIAAQEIARHGGRYLARGASPQVEEADWNQPENVQVNVVASRPWSTPTRGTPHRSTQRRWLSGTTRCTAACFSCTAQTSRKPWARNAPRMINSRCWERRSSRPAHHAGSRQQHDHQALRQ